MALSAIIEWEASEVRLRDNVLMGYHFSSDTSGYAKAYAHHMKLRLDIDVLALLSHTAATFDKNNQALESLRAWGNLKYDGADGSYYRPVYLSHTHGDELFRDIRFSHAYVENFSEVIEPENRSHIISLELLQKEDKFRYDQRE